MCKSRILLIVVLFYVSAVPISSATNIIYVDVNGPNDPGTGGFSDPFRKIQDGINAANGGDTVEIHPGLYTGQGNYNLDPNGKAITIRSSDPNNQNVIENAIIDPNKAGRGFCFVSGEDPNCVISGLTIRNGLAADDSGGAILCYNSNPIISNCVIKSNAADWYGGAIFCYDGSPLIIGCTINGNSAQDGGVLECWSGTVIIRNCVISNNTAANNGGAIDCYWEGQAELHNCTVVANSAGTGGALHCIDDGKATIQNSIIWSNDAAKGTQIAVQSSPFSTSEVTVKYSDVQGGQSDVYDPCEHLIWGGGNIDSEPCFASFDSNGDPNLWDFHLQSACGRWDENFHRVDFNKDRIINLLDFAELASEWLKEDGNVPEDLNRNGKVDWADLQILTTYFLTTGYGDKWVFDALTSPCVDAGDPNSEWVCEPWPNGKRINMGAYGGTKQASMNGNPGDFNIDGTVGFADFAEFSSKWLVEETCIEDLSNNGVVEFADLHVFAENWLWEKQ